MILTPEDVEAIARRVVELQRETAAPADPDPWLTRKQAAAFLNLASRSFDRQRELHPEALKPALEHPMRWSTNALIVFKMTRGVLPARRGRPRQTSTASQNTSAP